MASLISQTKSTILITGGNGSLGSAIALHIARSQPGKHHLILTARKLTDPRTISTSSLLKSLNTSFEFQIFDLSSLDNVRSFAAKLIERMNGSELPPFAGGGVVLSAAINTLAKDSRTKDGWNELYGVNVLAQVLLVRELLPLGKGGLVVYVGSAAHAMATVDHFSTEAKVDIDAVNSSETLGLGDAMKRYGASKLWGTMAMYALQRRLDAKAENTIQLVSLDPGGMSGDSNLGLNHWIFSSAKVVLGLLNPIVKRLKKDAYNPPEVPAKAIADLFGEGKSELGGKYFVLDDETQSSAASLEVSSQEEVWEKIASDLDLKAEI